MAFSCVLPFRSDLEFSSSAPVVRTLPGQPKGESTNSFLAVAGDTNKLPPVDKSPAR